VVAATAISDLWTTQDHRTKDVDANHLTTIDDCDAYLELSRSYSCVNHLASESLLNIAGNIVPEDSMKKPSALTKKTPKTVPQKSKKKTASASVVKMKKTTRKSAAKTRKVPLSMIKASAAPKGCCIVVTGDAPDRPIPNLTQAECELIEDAHPGTATHWTEGSCA
jgi:hypothetical protein